MADKKDDTLTNLMLSRAPENLRPLNGYPKLPQIPWKDEDPLTRFVGGFTGMDPEGGGVAGLAGAAAGTLNPLDDVMRYFKGAKSIMRPGAVTTEVAGRLPQLADAFQQSGKYTPEIAAESARLMGEMIDDPTYKAAFQKFAERDPMGAGHVKELHFGRDKNQGFMHNLNTGGAQYSATKYPVEGFPELEYQSKIRVNPLSPPNLLSKNERAKTMAHELQHASQQVMEGRNFNPNYFKMQDQFGYEKNPYEWEANKVGDEIANMVKLSKLSGR